MEFKDYTDFANENATCFVATQDGDQARVRALRMLFADDTGFYFNTEANKEFYRQLKANQKIEICYFADNKTMGKMMRVTGNVEFIDDITIREGVMEARPYLKAHGVKSAEDPLLVVFAVRKGEAFFWTMANSGKEAQIPRFNFGK